MKLLMVIVNEEYQKRIATIFQEYECSATVIASTGDFLSYGDTIFMVGVEEDKASFLMKMMEKEFHDTQTQDTDIFSAQESAEIRGKAFCLEISQFAKINPA